MNTDRWIAVVTFFVGLALTVFLYFRAKETRRIFYSQCRVQIASLREINEFDTHYSINLEDHEVSSIYREYIIVWSNGSRSVRFDEHLVSIQINIADQVSLLDARIALNDDLANGAEVSVNGHSIALKFEYLRPQDAILLTVDHNDSRIDAAQIAFREKERDVVRRSESRQFFMLASPWLFEFSLFIFLLFPFMVGTIVLDTFYPMYKFADSMNVILTTVVVISMIVVVPAILSAITSIIITRIHRRRILGKLSQTLRYYASVAKREQVDLRRERYPWS